VGVLLFLNVLLLAFVHARRLRLASRRRRAERFRAGLDELLAEQDLSALAKRIRGLNELERPIAAEFVIERLRTESPAERAQTLAWMREIGAIDVLLRSAKRWQPWRRALAIRMLGLAGATEAVPLLIERLSDRSRYVREAAVRALGRIGDERARPELARLFEEPGAAGAGIVYQALLAFGADAEPVFAEGLRSQNEHVRVASVFGLGSLLEPGAAAAQVEHMLGDESPLVRRRRRKCSSASAAGQCRPASSARPRTSSAASAELPSRHRRATTIRSRSSSRSVPSTIQTGTLRSEPARPSCG
jgi:hypothetical protein